MEQAFFRFEVKVVKLRYFEDVVDCLFMVVEVCSSCDTDVIHIYADHCSQGFVFENNIVIDVVHHRLKGCR